MKLNPRSASTEAIRRAAGCGGEGVVQRVLAQLVAQPLELFAEGVAAGMLAHDERGLGHADALGGHDLVGLGILQHAVLVDAALMRERIAADDRLVVLHREGSDRRNDP